MKYYYKDGGMYSIQEIRNLHREISVGDPKLLGYFNLIGVKNTKSFRTPVFTKVDDETYKVEYLGEPYIDHEYSDDGQIIRHKNTIMKELVQQQEEEDTITRIKQFLVKSRELLDRLAIEAGYLDFLSEVAYLSLFREEEHLIEWVVKVRDWELAEIENIKSNPTYLVSYDKLPKRNITWPYHK